MSFSPSAILLFLLHHSCQVLAGNGEPFSEKGQKNYEDDEEGKLAPHRWEGHVIGSFTLTIRQHHLKGIFLIFQDLPYHRGDRCYLRVHNSPSIFSDFSLYLPVLLRMRSASILPETEQGLFANSAATRQKNWRNLEDQLRRESLKYNFHKFSQLHTKKIIIILF